MMKTEMVSEVLVHGKESMQASDSCNMGVLTFLLEPKRWNVFHLQGFIHFLL
jgi:hypothetical protein